MKKSAYRASASLATIALMFAAATPSFAQTVAAAKDKAAPASGLDEIVVTASGGDKSRLNSAASVASVKAETIKNFQPSSESDVFRMIPGIQVAGTAGPGGNSNIAVRGLPVATGGSPFVQIQEDGLPTVLFGDIQFGNNDYWTHFDASVARIETIRGGTAATYASQAPGAVINYISETGKKEGGYLELQKGVNFDENKVSMRYGGQIADGLYFHVGGYFKNGRGPLHADYNVSDSYQIKANVTKEFDEGKGYIRFLFKFADTKEPNYTGAPALATISGKNVSNIRPFPGFDGRRDSNYSIYNQDFLIVNRTGALERVKMDGITTNAKSFGNQFHYEFSDAITIDNNLRLTKMSGGFAAPFFNVEPTSNIIGSTVNGKVVGSIRYVSGPNAGQIFAGAYLDNNVNVKTNVRDIGSFADDLALTGKYDAGIGKVTARAGWFFMSQKIAMDWHVNKSTREISGDNPSQLDLYSVAGAKLTSDGIAGFNNNWGNCCARDYDLNYSNSAPYVSLDLDAERFGVDGSLRFDRVKASGYVFQGGAEFNTVVGGVNIPTITSNGTREDLSYTRSYMSWTAGGLFKVNSDTSLFVRASRGGRFNGDRQTASGKIQPNGALTQDGITASVDFVKQYEIGLKNRGELIGGNYTVELSLLKANFKQSTYELTATKCPGGAGGCVIDAKYKSTGAEFVATYARDGFDFFATATYSKSKKAGSGATTFTRADGIADLYYTFAANYTPIEMLTVGFTATGQTGQVDGGGNSYPGGTTFNTTLKVRPLEKLELGIQAYNLFNKFDLRGNGNTSGLGISGSPAIGRTITASVKYAF
jgi:outer membrane receptor protein involved in Fe transport